METARYITQEELNSNIYQLFHRSFLVKVTYLDLMDSEEIKRYGVLTSWDEEDDIRNANTKQTVALTIPKLLELFRNKVPFYLTNQSEEHLMYNIIATHIKEWREYAQSSINLNRIPMEDLRDLSELAKLIYQNRDRGKDIGIDEDMESIRSSFTSSKLNGMWSVEDILIKEEPKEKTVEKVPHLEETSILDSIFANRRY